MLNVIFIAIFSAIITHGIKMVNEGDSFGWFYIIFNSVAILSTLIGMIRL